MNHGKMLTMAVVLLLHACAPPEDIQSYLPTETYPADTLLGLLEPRRAMVVIAHDDDMCAMSGTLAMLNQQGWEVAVVSFGKTESRNRAQREACRHILDTVMFVPLSETQYRNDIGQAAHAYAAIPKADFERVFNRSLVEEMLLPMINSFGPTVVFTLDNDIGGYGHPEHVFVSQLVLDAARAGQITPRYVYQSVFTDHMETTIMDRHAKRLESWGLASDEWDKAKRIYGVNGMPEPTVQIPVTDFAELKMNYLRSYDERERKTIGFFIPAFEDYEAKEYFTLFDREFFHVIPVD